jgi:ParB family transcriptional regulator, chromosome partitioning protein
MTDIQMIPLNKLDRDPKNVRKTYRADGIIELAASIRAEGPLQNIVVRPGTKRGRFFVTAGGRRFAAYTHLVETGDWPKDQPIECKVREADEATEISLTENVQREAMHRADEFEAFLLLAEAGKTPKDIAERFGTSELIVNRRLALAKVSPVIFDLYRKDEVSFEQLQAFTITDDHARQVEVWENLPYYNREPRYIKQMLTSEEVAGTDKRVRFIGGLDAYEAAGGIVRRDLFDVDGGGFATDSGLVEKLVLEKLEAEAVAIRAEGWKWVEAYSTRPDDIWNFERVYPAPVDLTEDETARMDALTDEYDRLADLIENGAADEDAEPRLAEVESELDALNKRQEAFNPDDLARSGVIVCLGYQGQLDVMRGLVRDEVARPNGAGDADGRGTEPTGEGEATSGTAKLTHSQALIEDLTAQKTAALRCELAENPDIALAAVVHALLLSVAYPYSRGATALEISASHEGVERYMKNAQDSAPALAFVELKERWGDHLPGNPADLWEWCVRQSQPELMVLLAFAASHSINAVETKFHGRSEALAHANQLGAALGFDMRKWFTTTSDTYFAHLNRQSIECAVAEAKGEDFAKGIAGMKKAEAAAYAERQIDGSGWLPAPIRIAANDDAAPETLPVAAE